MLKGYSTDEVLEWIIFCNCLIKKDRKSRDVLQCNNVNSIEVIHAIENAGIPRGTIIRNVRLGEEVDSVGIRVNHRRPLNTNTLRCISTIDVRREVRGLDLTRFDRRPSYSIKSADEILVGRKKDYLCLAR